MKCLYWKIRTLWLFLYITNEAFCRIHKLHIADDYRRYISLTSFGFYKGGHIDVKLQDLYYDPQKSSDIFGFTLERVLNNGANDRNYEISQDSCLLTEYQNGGLAKNEVIYIILDLSSDQRKLKINCTSSLSNLRLYEDKTSLPEISLSEQSLIRNGKKYSAESAGNRNLRGKSCSNLEFPLIVNELPEAKTFSARFVIYVPTENEEGLYDLFFHNCVNYGDNPVALSFFMEIEEYNLGSFLSAGEMPLPALYFMLSVIFMLTAAFWIYILVKSRHPVYKIHYLMAVLVVMKSLALLFHSINYHFIEIKGDHVATWAILYYITHLLKGSVLFVTLILIGTGWNFIKNILSQKDKKLFMFLIPLQVIANIAEIIIDESEEGDASYTTWLNIFTFVDLVCCVAILFPVLWSIRHLQEALTTDGKAAASLRKLLLFRHFYVIVVTYIYTTRFIIYLLRLSVPFQYEWLDEMFREIAAFVFYTTIGYKFRPASENPYFLVSQDEMSNEMDIVVSPSGHNEGVKRLTRLMKCEEHSTIKEDEELLLYSRDEEVEGE